jgi:hypothetical protein
MLRRDPLFHFLLLGGLLFVALSWLDTTAPAERIVITASRIAELSRAAELMQGRPPSQAEIERLVAAAVREEVYYREALARGLDIDDTVVRQRMIEKMRELTENLIEPVPPDADLEAWFNDNAAVFQIPEQISFDQVFFNDIDDAQAVLNEGTDPSAAGEATPLSDRYQSADAARIRTLFGEAFADTVFAAGMNAWIGPLESGVGWHLVRVFDRSSARDPDYAEIEDRVREAFAAERLARANQAAFAELSAGFDIAVEWQNGTEPVAWP